ncbi:MAG: hypothetical protein Q4C89_14900 [Deinococcus sp.]|uniref:hypothetical protein n=1 Tax=Deinococcus sp. TaxID=47478 RepID=UPI0026DC5E91|nr:hypothetical protein [Deinococcus sp.]MDO4247306.1 hypothetical protein [Deinococcus sp.]
MGEVLIPPAAERALTQATCLLPRARRAEVRAELLGHLWQTQLDTQVGGLDEDGAWAAALDDLGPPLRLALGLGWGYWRGALMRALLVGLALGSVGYAMQTHSPSAQTVTQEARP